MKSIIVSLFFVTGCLAAKNGTGVEVGNPDPNTSNTTTQLCPTDTESVSYPDGSIHCIADCLNDYCMGLCDYTWCDDATNDRTSCNERCADTSCGDGYRLIQNQGIPTCEAGCDHDQDCGIDSVCAETCEDENNNFVLQLDNCERSCQQQPDNNYYICDFAPYFSESQTQCPNAYQPVANPELFVLHGQNICCVLTPENWPADPLKFLCDATPGYYWEPENCGFQWCERVNQGRCLPIEE